MLLPEDNMFRFDQYRVSAQDLTSWTDAFATTAKFKFCLMWGALPLNPTSNDVQTRHASPPGLNIKKGADPDNAKKALSWEACGRVV